MATPKRPVIFAALVWLAVGVVEGEPIPMVKYQQVKVDPAAWTVSATSTLENMGECGSLCYQTNDCKAFAYDSSSQACELGPLPNIPADEDPAGKAILMYTPPADCRSPLAISQGYQLLYNKWYRVGETPVEHSDAEALCEDAGARLAIFDAREDWLAVQNVTASLPAGATSYQWIGAMVDPAKGATLCNEVQPPDPNSDACVGFYIWDDGKTLSWTGADILDWAPAVSRNIGSEMCAIHFNGIDDAPCTGTPISPICQVSG